MTTDNHYYIRSMSISFLCFIRNVIFNKIQTLTLIKFIKLLYKEWENLSEPYVSNTINYQDLTSGLKSNIGMYCLRAGKTFL